MSCVVGSRLVLVSSVTSQMRLFFLHLFLQTITVPSNSNGDAVMEQTIKNSRDNHRIVKQLLPFRKRFVGGDDRGSALISNGDKLVKEMTLLAGDGCIPDLVNDNQCGLVMAPRARFVTMRSVSNSVIVEPPRPHLAKIGHRMPQSESECRGSG